MSNIYTNSYSFLLSLIMNPKNFRALKNNEFEFIEAGLVQISPKIVSYFQERRSLLYVSIFGNKNENLIYLITEEINKVLKRFQQIVDIISAGIYLGFIEIGKFFLSLEGAELLLKEKLVPVQRFIKVNKEGEKAILYGNSIEKKMILDFSSEVKKNSLIFIFNPLKELIALGNVVVDLENFEVFNERDILIKNLVDKGYYLRRKQ
jgi:ribosome biogenesis protein Nip4